MSEKAQNKYGDFLKQPLSSIKENVIVSVFLLCSIVSVITTIGVVIILMVESVEFFARASIASFFTGTRWSPMIEPVEFGVLPLISGTLAFTFLTAVIGLSTGLLAAVYLSEYANKRFRDIVKPALEVLAGIPTVVYGYFALVYITPLLKHIIPSIRTFNILSASIVVGIMIIPTVASISEDALRSVPFSLREAGYGLGATRFKVTTTIVIPAALSGILASFILGISRAIGETMAVTIAAGNLARMVNPLKPASLFLEPVQTMTSAMVEIGMSDVTGESLAYKSLFAIGLTLFIITLILNLISQYIKYRFREKYH